MQLRCSWQFSPEHGLSLLEEVSEVKKRCDEEAEEFVTEMCQVGSLFHHLVVVMFGGNQVRELHIGFHDVAFLPSRARFSPHFLKVVVEVMASRPPHVI